MDGVLRHWCFQEVEKKIEDLKNFCTDLRKEVQQRVQEKRMLREDLEVFRRSIVKEERELETLTTEMDQQKVSLQGFELIPEMTSYVYVCLCLIRPRSCPSTPFPIK